MTSSDPEERRRQRAKRLPREGKVAWDKERTRELFHLYKQEGDTEARDQLVVSHLNLVRFLAGKFRNRGETMEDLVQVGTIGLIKAIDRFDPDRGLEFTTFATPTIMGEIKRHFRDKGWSVRVPRRLQELSAKVNQAKEDLLREMHREPTVDEVATYVGATVEEVLEAMEASKAYSSTSLEAPSEGDEDDMPSILDHYPAEDSEMEATDDRMLLEDAMRGLSPREQEVVRMRYEQGLTQVEIAKALGISQVQVSRMLRKVLKDLQERIAPEDVG